MGRGWRTAAGLQKRALDLTRPATLRSRLRAMPAVHIPGLWPNKVEAITRLERSLYDDRPRALIQMATGSGKTKLAITASYRLIKYAGARRVLFLVDRANLGEQAEKEFQSYVAPDINRKFTELYNVQRLTSNTVAESAKVVITTIQRLYSMLSGQAELDPEVEERSAYEAGVTPSQPPDTVEPAGAAAPRTSPQCFGPDVRSQVHRPEPASRCEQARPAPHRRSSEECPSVGFCRTRVGSQSLPPSARGSRRAR